MQRDLLLLEEMIDAAEQAHLLGRDQTRDALLSDRQRRDALLWNFTVMGEAAAAAHHLPALVEQLRSVHAALGSALDSDPTGPTGERP